MGGLNLLYFGFIIVLVNSGLSSVAAQKGRKIEFSTAPVDSENIQYNDDPEPLAGTQEYYESLSWITVTSDGYEQEESAFADIMNYNDYSYDEDNEEDKEEEFNDYDNDDDDDEPTFSKPTNVKEFDDSSDPTNVPHQSDESYDLKDTEEFDLFEADEELIDKLGNDREKRKVFGRDNRIRVNPVRFPYTAIGRVDSGCTGTFIARRAILTAGHCVHSGGRKGMWYETLDFGRCKNCYPNRGIRHSWKRAFIFKGWSRYRRRKYDLAVILVNNPSPVFVSFKTSNRFRSGSLHIAGYPGERSKRGCMYQSQCRIRTRRRGYRRKLMKYRCDTTPGMSGSAIIKYYSRKPVIQGVHAYSGVFRNGGPQITSKYARKIRGWINGWGGN